MALTGVLLTCRNKAFEFIKPVNYHVELCWWRRRPAGFDHQEPPAADIRFRPVLQSLRNIVSSSAQWAPKHATSRLHKSIGVPPRSDTFFSLRPTVKPIQFPSGEKKGALPHSVPGIGSASNSPNRRRYSCIALFRRAT